MPLTTIPPIAIGWLFAAALLMTGGCASKVRWREPSVAHPQKQLRCLEPLTGNSPWAGVEAQYARGRKLIKADDACGVDALFEVALATASHANTGCGDCRVTQLHKSSLNLIVQHGQRLCRLNPHSGLRIVRHGREVMVPIRQHGFLWASQDFDSLAVVGNYQADEMSCLYRQSGIGVPLVVTRLNDQHRPFMPKKSCFAASLCLRPGDLTTGNLTTGNLTTGDLSTAAELAKAPSAAVATLDLYDPTRCSLASTSAGPQPIAKDLSAAIAYRLKDERTTILENFIDPDSMSGEPQLFLLEPYQPGKIPVVFVHGLLSNPFTWVEMLNTLQACPWYVENFQSLVYEYPTGRAFFSSAAKLRRELAQAQEQFDPHRTDACFRETILVGHSMGGLIAKSLVSSSGNELWSAIANQPRQNVSIPPEFQKRLSESLFFQPSEQVSRAIFIATPHRGSSLSRRLIGRIGAAAVRPPTQFTLGHQQLIACNPGVFSEEMQKRIPTSIDLLEPNSCLLQTLGRLPVAERVQLHTIAGDWRCTLKGEWTDTVVPLSSALGIKSASEFITPAKHEKIHKKKIVIEEVMRIFKVHLAHLKAQSAQESTLESAETTPEFELNWREWSGSTVLE